MITILTILAALAVVAVISLAVLYFVPKIATAVWARRTYGRKSLCTTCYRFTTAHTH